MELIASNTDEDILNHRLGEEMIRFICDGCDTGKMIALKHLEPDCMMCAECRNKRRK